MVKFKKGTRSGNLNNILKSAGVEKVIERLGPSGKQDAPLLVKLDDGKDVLKAVEQLIFSPEVEYAEPNYVRHLLYTPGDPEFTNQWNLANNGQEIEGNKGTTGADINAERAWDIEKGYSNPVTIAVLDTGLTFAHEDLKNKVWANADEIADNGIDDDGNGYIDDVNGYNWSGISQTCYYYYSGTTKVETYRSFGSAGDTRMYAQSITGTGCELTHIGIELSSVNTPSMNITISVRETLEAVDLASFTISPSEISGQPQQILKQLSSPVTLSSGSTYYLVFQTAGTDSDNYYRIYEAQGSHFWWPVYKDGSEYLWDGSAWSNNSSDDFYFKTNPNFYPHDDQSHGTLVSGIAAAENNNVGMVGVSLGAKIMPLKVSDASGILYMSEICEAIRYAADNGAQIVNMSFGDTQPSAAERDAIEYAGGKGVVRVAAAGNFGDSTMWYPAGYDGVIGVGATDNSDARADFSVCNSSIDVAAPGKDVLTTSYFGGYFFANGTSTAAPHVAGLAALILSKKPGYQTGQVEKAIEYNSKDLGDAGRDDYFGYGRLDAYEAISNLEVPRITGITPEYGTVGTAVTIDGSSFSGRRGSSSVTFNGVEPDACLSWSDGEIKCVVPAGVYGIVKVKVTTFAGTSNEYDFSAANWYLAEGTTAWGFETSISIENPCDEELTARVTYNTKAGRKRGPDVTLPPKSQTRLNPAEVVPNQDFSTAITCLEGRSIAVDRTMVWTGPGAGSPEAHSSIGVMAPSMVWYLPEGSSNWGFETWLLIQNPNDSEAHCTVTYMTEGGNPEKFEKAIAPNSRESYNMASDIGSHDTSIKVVSDIPVICERAMYRNNRREGHGSIGTTSPATSNYLAEGSTAWGFATYVLVQNPNSEPVDVTLSCMTAGGRIDPAGFTMPPNSRKTIKMNDVPGLSNTDFSARVNGSRPIIAERAMYWDAGNGEACHDSIGISSPGTTFLLPDGETSRGRETFTLVQNPNGSEVTVEVTYLKPDGRDNVTFTDSIPAYSRKTYNMYDWIPSGRAAIVVSSKTTGRKIVVERAMYWNNRGAGTGTIGAME